MIRGGGDPNTVMASKAESSNTFGSTSVPLRQGAVLLKTQEAPRQLNETATHPRVARTNPAHDVSTRSLWRPGEAGVTGYGASVLQVSGQNFLHQHIRRLDANADDARQHPNHRMPASSRRPFQALQPSLLDGVDLLASRARSRRISSNMLGGIGVSSDGARQVSWTLCRTRLRLGTATTIMFALSLSAM
jgi:hypothetical protein